MTLPEKCMELFCEKKRRKENGVLPRRAKQKNNSVLLQYLAGAVIAQQSHSRTEIKPCVLKHYPSFPPLASFPLLPHIASPHIPSLRPVFWNGSSLCPYRGHNAIVKEASYCSNAILAGNQLYASWSKPPSVLHVYYLILCCKTTTLCHKGTVSILALQEYCILPHDTTLSILALQHFTKPFVDFTKRYIIQTQLTSIILPSLISPDFDL